MIELKNVPSFTCRRYKTACFLRKQKLCDGFLMHWFHDHFLCLYVHAGKEIRSKESDYSQQTERKTEGNRWLLSGNIVDESDDERNGNTTSPRT